MSTENKTPMKKLPKKEFRIIKKKSVIAFGMIAIVAVAGIITGIVIISNIQNERILYVSYVGVGVGVGGIDPLETYAPTDYEIISQAAEGLYIHDSASEHSKVIPNLAVNHSRNANATEYTFELRQGVQFHDGTAFNAIAVQWNIERIYTLIDNGKMPPTKKQFWLFSDGEPIINRTEIVGDYTAKFILNKPYVPLPTLLTSHSAFILSPASTPSDHFIDTLNEKIIGTGPFIYESAVFTYNPEINFTMNLQTTFSSNPNYWGGKPQIDKLIFKNYAFNEVRYDAIQSGDLSVLSGYLELIMDTDQPINIYYNKDILNTFINHPDIIVDEGPPAAYFCYLIMNNKEINVTMRKAISYAFNYSAFIDKWLNGHGTRLKSPIPAAILYSNTTGIDVPYYNVSIARQTLKDVNWGGIAGTLTVDDDISADNEWERLVDDGTPLATYNYTTIPSPFSDTLVGILKGNLKQIGIKLEVVNLTIHQYFDIFGNHINRLRISWVNFIPGFNDPSSIINTLCSIKALDLNYCQVNDTTTQLLMEEALGETNPIIRREKYYQIQKRLIEEVFPMCYLYRKNHFNIYRSNVRGLQFNQFYPIYKDVYFE